MVDLPLDESGGSLYLDIPAVGSRLDLSSPPAVVGAMGMQRGLPLLTGVDPRWSGTWRRLPGFHRISQTAGNSRIKGSEVGGADTDQIDADFFRPITVKYGSQPYERRGFVVSANNRLIYKYYDTSTSAWSVRTLVSDLDASFGTRTDFDVVAEGRYLYVSRSAISVTDSPTPKTSPQVFWWDDAKSDWLAVGNAIYGTVYGVTVYSDSGVNHILACGDFSIVGGSATNEDGKQYLGVVLFDGYRWVPIVECIGGIPYCVTQWNDSNGKAWIVVGGAFTSVNDSTGTAVANTYGLCKIDPYLFTISDFASGIHTSSAATSTVYAMYPDANGDMYITGYFTKVGSGPTTVSNSARWSTGGSWNSLAGGGWSGLAGLSIAKFNSNYYFAGAMAERVRYWDGAAWHNGYSSAAPNGYVRALEVFNSKLYAAGAFTTVDGLTVPNIARITGTATWENPFSGLTAPGNITALRADAANGFLYIGLGPEAVNGNPALGAAHAYGILRWSGSGNAQNLSQGDLKKTEGSTYANANSIWVDTKVYGITQIYVGGYFGQAGTTQTRGIAVWRATDGTVAQRTAQVGAAQFSPPVLNLHGGRYWGGFAGARFKGVGYSYGAIIRLVDNARGLATDPIDPFTWTIDTTYPQTYFHYFTINIPKWVMQAMRPTAVQVFRSIGVLQTAGTTDATAAYGPFYLESEWRIEPDGDFGTDFYSVQLYAGYLSDEALVDRPQFDPRYDLAGSHGLSSAIGVNKDMLFSLSGANATDRKGNSPFNETFFDIRWSPPWVFQAGPFTRRECTVFAGHYRVTTFAGEVPRFITCGDYELFMCRRQITRFQKAGEYLSINDGPSGIGPAGRHAAVAIGGELIFVSGGGELYRLTAATMSLQEVEWASRWLRQRLATLLTSTTEADRIYVGYDPSSKMIIVVPRPSTSNVSAKIPAEALIIDIKTGNCTTLADCNIAGVGVGDDPETGQPAMFIITRSGVILSPDWQNRGIWATNSTWKNLPFMTMHGATGDAYATVTGITSLGGSAYRITASGAAFDMDGSFGLALNHQCYVFRDNPDADPQDSVPRKQMVFSGTITAMTATTLDVVEASSSLSDYGRTRFNQSLANFSQWTGVTVMVAPVVMQVGLPPIRDLQAPNLFDVATVVAIGTSPGRIADELIAPVATRDFAIPGTVVLDNSPWRHDDYQYTAGASGPTLPWPVSSATPNPLSFPINRNQDSMAVALAGAGHHVIPVLTCFSPSLLFELNAVRLEVMIDKGGFGES